MSDIAKIREADGIRRDHADTTSKLCALIFSVFTRQTDAAKAKLRQDPLPLDFRVQAAAK
jgi:hypothetical protein